MRREVLGYLPFCWQALAVDEARYAGLYVTLALADMVVFELELWRDADTVQRRVLSAAISRFRLECALPPAGSGRPLTGPSARGAGYVLTNWQAWIAALPERGGVEPAKRDDAS